MSTIDTAAALERITRARTALLLDQPFYGTLAMRLNMVADASIGTIGTNGVDLRYNPSHVEALTEPELVGTLAHEVLHCFPGNTPILTSRGLVNIERVAVGDSVYCKSGQFTRVLATSSRKHKGKVIRIKPTLGSEFVVTPEHPILCARLPHPIARNVGTAKSVEAATKHMKRLTRFSRYIPAGEIDPRTDVLLFALPHFETSSIKQHTICRLRRHYAYKKIKIDSDTAYFLGWFVGDGSLSTPSSGSQWFGKAKERVITITLSNHNDHQRLENVIATKLHRSPLVFQLKDTKAKRVVFSSSSLAKYLRRWFYSNTSKTIPSWMISMPKSILENFVQGLIESDGHVDAAGKREFCNTSTQVIGILSLILFRLGYNPSLSCQERLAPHRNLYKLTWRESVGWRSCIRKGKYLVVPLRSICEEQYDGRVHNIETSNHTYALPFVTVHNCALGHVWRRGCRDPKEWNIACDIKANAMLRKDGFTLPDGAVEDPSFGDEESAESIYSKRKRQPPPELPSDESEPEPDDSGDASEDEGESDAAGDDEPGDSDSDSDGDGGDGDGGDDESGDGSGDSDEDGGESEDGEGQGGGSVMGDCPTGEFSDGPAESDDPDQMTEADWQIATEQAIRVALKAGQLPGGMDREVQQTREARNDWRSETREFVTNNIPTDQSWSRPNRRFAASGLYLPGPIKDNVGPLVAVIDVSGSIYGDILEAFGGCLTGILQEARPERLHVIYVDTAVRTTDEFTPDDGEVTIRTTGGGGTLFQPAFDWVAQNDINPVGMIYLTDLECFDDPQDPSYPVLWITPEHVTLEGRFGRTIRIDEGTL